ncbi:MAG: NHLP bacteriocin export ABC transporter permease/ATPase subunit [Lachnospiraceae bacterium]|nr:NHLP bacteriocin export ABC transporter permease/ATPase subunit [Lachnospiraceae bacterium]
MKEIRLDGGKYHITNEKGSIYRVISGHVLVYIVPVSFKDGSIVCGRRKLLFEAVEGEEIPALCHESDLLGAWRFLFLALDHAVISVSDESADEEKLLSFANRLRIKASSGKELEEELIEKYNLLSIKEEGFIYATKEESRNTLMAATDLIRRFFTTGKEDDPDFVSSGNALYDAAAFICRKEKITVADFEKVRQAAGRNFTLQDIARVSHFSIREVVPAEKWYKKDSGPMLMFKKEGGMPVPCIPSGPSGYLCHDPGTGLSKRVDALVAEEMQPQGYVFYRPFPQKKLTMTDIILFGFQKIYKSDIVRFLLLSLAGLLVGLLLPLLNQQVYDRYIPFADPGGLLAIGGVILSCTLGNISFNLVKNLASFRSMKSMEYAVQTAAIDRLFNLPESFFRDYDAAELAGRVMNLSVIYQILSDSIVNVALTALFSVGYLFAMFSYSKEMAAVSLLLLGILMTVLIWLGIRQTKYESQKVEADMKARSSIFQFVSGIEKLRISASENRAILKYLQIFTRQQGITAKKERTTIMVGVVTQIAPTVFSLIFYHMMIRQSIPLSIGQYAGFTAAFSALSTAFLSVAVSFLAVNMVKPMYESVKPVLETMPESVSDASLPGDIIGRLEVSHVSFGYSDSEEQVLSDINLQVEPGEYVALVGPSGCGKSTLLKLLLGFEKPKTGKIYYDNKDIDEMDKRELRKKFGVVLQDGGMIAGSIFDNIVITAPTTGLERVQEVIEEVGLKDDIDNMPMGIHTVVTEGAGTISGGQKQRILIARALVGKPKMVFFDEATSALDNLTQNMVVETLERLDATKIVIAHRLSTIRHCDRIIVMEKGRIIEEGTFDELMSRKGFFYEMAVRQM